jgi:hypothetical protein
MHVVGLARSRPEILADRFMSMYVSLLHRSAIDWLEHTGDLFYCDKLGMSLFGMQSNWQKASIVDSKSIKLETYSSGRLLKLNELGYARMRRREALFASRLVGACQSDMHVPAIAAMGIRIVTLVAEYFTPHSLEFNPSFPTVGDVSDVQNVAGSQKEADEQLVLMRRELEQTLMKTAALEAVFFTTDVVNRVYSGGGDLPTKTRSAVAERAAARASLADLWPATRSAIVELVGQLSPSCGSDGPTPEQKLSEWRMRRALSDLVELLAVSSDDSVASSSSSSCSASVGATACSRDNRHTGRFCTDLVAAGIVPPLLDLVSQRRLPDASNSSDAGLHWARDKMLSDAMWLLTNLCVASFPFSGYMLDSGMLGVLLPHLARIVAPLTHPDANERRLAVLRLSRASESSGRESTVAWAKSIVRAIGNLFAGGDCLCRPWFGERASLSPMPFVDAIVRSLTRLLAAFLDYCPLEQEWVYSEVTELVRTATWAVANLMRLAGRRCLSVSTLNELVGIWTPLVRLPCSNIHADLAYIVERAANIVERRTKDEAERDLFYARFVPANSCFFRRFLDVIRQNHSRLRNPSKLSTPLTSDQHSSVQSIVMRGLGALVSWSSGPDLATSVILDVPGTFEWLVSALPLYQSADHRKPKDDDDDDDDKDDGSWTDDERGFTPAVQRLLQVLANVCASSPAHIQMVLSHCPAIAKIKTKTKGPRCRGVLVHRLLRMLTIRNLPGTHRIEASWAISNLLVCSTADQLLALAEQRPWSAIIALIRDDQVPDRARERLIVTLTDWTRRLVLEAKQLKSLHPVAVSMRLPALFAELHTKYKRSDPSFAKCIARAMDEINGWQFHIDPSLPQPPTPIHPTTTTEPFKC